MRVHEKPRRVLPRLAGWIVALGIAALPCVAGSFRVLPDESDLVVVTRKGGFAAAMAHDHVIAATGYEARLEFTPADPASATFELTLPVRNLVVDDPAVQARLAPRLEELKVREGSFSDVSAKDRSKIRGAMLGKDQLDAERHPTLSAKAVVSGPRDPAGSAADPFRHTVRLKLEIRGRVVEREAAARHEYRDGRLEVEALASFEFTEFGIEPYSAFLGAVRNRDRFHVYVRIVAVAEEADPGSGGAASAQDGDDPS